MITSFSLPTLKILMGICQNMFFCHHHILRSFCQKLLLQIHISLEFEDLVEILTLILCEDNNSNSKIKLNTTMFVRAVQRIDSDKLKKFIQSANFFKLLKLKKNENLDCL